MKNAFAIGCLALTLSACSTSTLTEGLPLLVGKKLDYAVDHLGYPNAEQTIAGKKVYIWGHSNTVTSMQTVSTPFYGNAYGAGGGMSYYGQSTTVVPRTYNFQCTIRLFANQKNVIEDWEWTGNDGGCEAYVDGVNSIIEDNANSKPVQPVKGK